MRQDCCVKFGDHHVQIRSTNYLGTRENEFVVVFFFFAVILRLVDEENVIFDEFSVASSDIGFIAFYWAGFTVAQSESAQEHRKVPYFTNPPIHVRKIATAPGSPYSFRIVRGFFYVPQNYQHSRNCETGPPVYRPSPRRLR